MTRAWVELRPCAADNRKLFAALNAGAAIALENRTQILAGTDGDEFVDAVTAFTQKRRP
ncbi:hypothetical protein R4P64_33225 [Rhodococcus sp. IEGM 1366]|uniref:hypothetical protein n=1 Tax=Rhodococcus sp. IEGM 1366 TaxID=3082223 RepID=UPI0029551D7B|nr:hypothetical protein [Rhodococcus sp. IEGM 1366]MDV8071376.1 hypothetical protein [Rhodococcus sp. IEGM 1366]